MRQSWYTDFFRLQYREMIWWCLSFPWLIGDITSTELQPCSYDVWHDRAGEHGKLDFVAESFNALNHFQVCPVKLPSILRCIYQNCCLFLVSRLCGDVIAI
jgi:hypothetical protein